MKKFLIVFGLVLGFASAVYADGHFCCGDGKTKEQCCAEMGKLYCPSDNSCRTRCPKVTPPACIGGCINPEGDCCTWCPSAEVCEKMGKCQKIVNGCYDCVECPVPNSCPAPQCMNEDGVCCDSCPRVCPEGQCLVNVNGCYECAPCKGPTPPVPDDDDDDVDDDDEPTETTSPEPDDDDDDEPTETDLCVGKPKYKDCKECDPSTGEYTVGGCGDTEECCAGNCVSNQCDMMKCETFVGDLTDLGGSAVCKCVSNCSENEYCYTGDAASLGGSIRCCPNIEPADEENCLTEICYYDDGGTSMLHGCPYRCSKCETEETCSNGHCCATGEVYIEEAQTCCPSTRDCGHFCCGEGEFCASRGAVCCKEGQVLCGTECKDKPIPDESKCEKLSDDECEIVSACTTGQECCGGKCIAKCTGCTTCVPERQACSTEPSCGGDTPTCCNGRCICGGCCDIMVSGSISDCNSAATAYAERQRGVDSCSYVCTNESIYNGYDSLGNACSYSAPLCSVPSGTEEEKCEKTYYQKDGQCKLGEYLSALDACCNPIEDSFCCTASGGSSCMTVDECKEKLKVEECATAPNGCCSGGYRCSETGCCATDKICGTKCCGEGEDCAGDTCCASDKKCGDMCCGEGQTCQNGTTCCDIIDKSKCPNGETMIAFDGCEICKCDGDTECPEGQVLVKNHENGIGICGQVCCEMKEDYYAEDDAAQLGSMFKERHYSKTGYVVEGAIGGACCGGYVYEEDRGINTFGRDWGTSYSRSYSIKTNNGVSYCASTYYYREFASTFEQKNEYVNDGKVCYLSGGGGSWGVDYCQCSDVGDPVGGKTCSY